MSCVLGPYTKMSLGSKVDCVRTPAEPPPSEPEPSKLGNRRNLMIGAAVLFLILLWQIAISAESANEEIPYFDFLSSVEDGLVTSAEIQPDGQTLVELTDGTSYETRIPVALTGDSLIDRLEAA